MRKTLILIPGLLNDAELWRDQREGLSDIAECRVADITQGETLHALAAQILSWAPPSFALAGFSLGGYVAQEIARIAPERIERLALLDTSIRADSDERAAMRRRLNQAATAPGRFHGFGDGLLKTYLHPSHLEDKRIVERIRGMTERLGTDVFVRQNDLDRKDGEATLRMLQCPVLILCGEQDSLTPLADHHDMTLVARNSTLVVVPHSGHMTPIEQPALVTQALREWMLKDQPRRRDGI